MPDWSEMFRSGTPVVEIFLRGTAMFLVLFVLMRVAGKRESGAHSLTDLLVVVLLAQAGAIGMTGEASGLLDGTILAATILGWSIALDAIAWRFPRLAPLLKPLPTPLVIDGRINRRALRREFYEVDELMADLRLQGITDLEEVSRAYLEANGQISVIRADHRAQEGRRRPPVP